MKIRRTQREAFAARAAETFPERVRALLLRRLPERRAEIEGEAALAKVRAQIEAARARGFAGERDAARWVALAWLFGDGFAEEPWAVAVLVDPRHETPTARVEALWEAAEDRALDAAEAQLTQAFAPEHLRAPQPA
jgi:pimeloyl-ACP methyl ester carboxylesterase